LHQHRLFVKLFVIYSDLGSSFSEKTGMKFGFEKMPDLYAAALSSTPLF
jgi:hypothetical protein